MNAKEYRRQVEGQLRVAPQVQAPLSPEQELAHVWKHAMQQVTDPARSAKDKKESIQTLQAGRFLGPEFTPYLADYVATLRAAATDAEPEVRRTALDILANLKDHYAFRMIKEGLLGTGEALVPPAVALGLLARDDHGSVSPVARYMIVSHTDVHVREQAARALGADPSARDILSSTMKNKSEHRQVRRSSAVALRALDRTLFKQGALDILRDKDDYPDIQATVGGVLQREGTAVPDNRRRSLLWRLLYRLRGPGGRGRSE